MRCRCSHLAVAVLVLCFVSGVAHAQVSAGGKNKVGNATRLKADLSAAVEVPGPGDADLSGKADLVVDPRRDQVCFDIELDASSSGADTVVAIHIHAGEAGEACAGDDCPAPLDLDFANKGLEGCVKKIGDQLLSSIADAPDQFYLHVHTGSFPAGAVRGQLESD